MHNRNGVRPHDATFLSADWSAVLSWLSCGRSSGTVVWTELGDSCMGARLGATRCVTTRGGVRHRRIPRDRKRTGVLRGWGCRGTVVGAGFVSALGRGGHCATLWVQKDV